MVPLYDVQVELRTSRKISKVYLAPQMEEIPCRYANGTVSYTVPQLECHQMVVLDYE
ncbi:hypothetical protein D3C71_2168430 [compost metagenome]